MMKNAPHKLKFVEIPQNSEICQFCGTECSMECPNASEHYTQFVKCDPHRSERIFLDICDEC